MHHSVLDSWLFGLRRRQLVKILRGRRGGLCSLLFKCTIGDSSQHARHSCRGPIIGVPNTFLISPQLDLGRTFFSEIFLWKLTSKRFQGFHEPSFGHQMKNQNVPKLSLTPRKAILSPLYLGHICILLQKFWQTLSDEFSMRNPTLQGAWAGINIEFVAVVELHLFAYIRKEKAVSHWWSPSSMIQQDSLIFSSKNIRRKH